MEIGIVAIRPTLDGAMGGDGQADQEEQEKVLSEIRGVVPDNKDPVSNLNLFDTFQFEIGLCYRTMTIF